MNIHNHTEGTDEAQKVSKSFIIYEKQFFAKLLSIGVKSSSKVLELQRYDAITRHIVKYILKTIETFEH